MGIGCFLCEVEVIEMPPRIRVRINCASQALPPGDHSPTKGDHTCNLFLLTQQVYQFCCQARRIILPHTLTLPNSWGQCLHDLQLPTPGEPCCLTWVFPMVTGMGNEHNSCYLKSVSLGIISNPHIHASHLLMTYRIHGSEIMFLQNMTPVWQTAIQSFHL